MVPLPKRVTISEKIGPKSVGFLDKILKGVIALQRRSPSPHQQYYTLRLIVNWESQSIDYNKYLVNCCLVVVYF